MSEQPTDEYDGLEDKDKFVSPVPDFSMATPRYVTKDWIAANRPQWLEEQNGNG